MNIDFAPTFMDLANIPLTDSTMDGQSFKKVILSGKDDRWRTEFLVEHSGEADEKIQGCPSLDHQLVSVRYHRMFNYS